MPTINEFQIRDGSIKDRHVADDAAIRQFKLALENWITDGVVHVVSEQPNWDGSQEGELYYVLSENRLYVGIGQDPYFSQASGASEGIYDTKILTYDVSEASDWDGNSGSQFQLPMDVAADGSQSFVYLNGVLLTFGPGHDFTVVNNNIIQIEYAIDAGDRVNIVVVQDTLSTAYATKVWVQNNVRTVTKGTIEPTVAKLGDEFYNETTSEWYKYNGTIWEKISP